MTDTFRALCAELANYLQGRKDLECGWGEEDPEQDLLDRARAALAQPEPDASQLSDGYHTFAELYEHRHALCLALMRAMPQHWWFSWRHADGELCFGGNDWFIVGAELSGVGSVTYHLPSNLYPVAQGTGAAELGKGRPWDGHTAADVVSRLRGWAAQPVPVGPSDRIISIAMATQECAFAWEPTARLIGNVCAEDIADLCGAVLALATTSEQIPPGPYSEHELRTQWNAQADEFNQWESLDLCEQLAWAQGRAIAADRTRWGRPAIEPVPVSERPILKSSNFNDANGHCWCGTSASVDETGDLSVEMPPSWELREPCAQDDCVLPHHALPVPTTRREEI